MPADPDLVLLQRIDRDGAGFVDDDGDRVRIGCAGHAGREGVRLRELLAVLQRGGWLAPAGARGLRLTERAAEHLALTGE